MPAIPVQFGDRSYEVIVGAGMLAELGRLAEARITGRNALLVVDDNLPRETVLAAETSLAAAGFDTTSTSITATESNKVITTVESLLSDAARARLERADVVIGLGGGITGDIAGFVAATYRRGVPVIQCPTTLLAMVDAAVGGKTGVNLTIDSNDGPGALRKNMIGAFWQPRLVLADIATLASLPHRERRAGLAECLKHGLISADIDPRLYLWTVEHVHAVETLDNDVLTELVDRNVRLKTAIVTADEREESPTGGRMLLNLGHTFGHALEAIPTLSPDGDPDNAPLLHGEAVAYGILAATTVASDIDLIDDRTATAISEGIATLGLEPLTDLPPSRDLVDVMLDDKKVRGGRIRLVLPTDLGRCRVFDNIDDTILETALDALRA